MQRRRPISNAWRPLTGQPQPSPSARIENARNREMAAYQLQGEMYAREMEMLQKWGRSPVRTPETESQPAPPLPSIDDGTTDD